MAKLTVRNVGPIREAELEVKKHTVFIGPQGTGKSTLAKLIAISSDREILPSFFNNADNLLARYSIENYLTGDSYFSVSNPLYNISCEGNIHFSLQKDIEDFLHSKIKKYQELTSYSIPPINSFIDWVPRKRQQWVDGISGGLGILGSVTSDFYGNFFKENLKYAISYYLPAERSLISTLSNAVWSLINANINFPKTILSFASDFEYARNHSTVFHIPFLDISYEYRQGEDILIIDGKSVVTSLSQSASGYQSIVPLLLVTDFQRRVSNRQFIIEEPELNLYPTAQKDLIYSLIGGLQPDVTYQDAEWVFTTHSPYILSSFNTLMLAYKVGNQSEELRAEVEKIIPSRCWINPNEFAAYYVDKGTIRSIVSEQTGMIADNELDDVSDDLADEQDQLLALRRSITRA